MKAKINPGNKEIALPKFFEQKIRDDLIFRAYVSSLKHQPYGAYILAGKQSSAGKQRHRRGKWKTLAGRGVSRIPRKFIIKRGEQYYWIGTFIPGVVGGRRAHPPKAIRKSLKINKKEKELALKCAIAATADKKCVQKKYEKKKITCVLPLVISSDELKKKNKEIKKFLEDLTKIKVERVRKVRPGKGKMRGRKYKKSYSLLLITGNNEKNKLNNYGIETVKAGKVSVKELASGGIPGRLTVYSEQAIQDLDKRINKIKEEKK
ncbi:MAG: 50S ribosomal protein L4 [archaeon]|nr:MAG: 50S ribosomal protein L4 [archaeon]